MAMPTAMPTGGNARKRRFFAILATFCLLGHILPREKEKPTERKKWAFTGIEKIFEKK
jgi:hypothetical protein